ncbi:MAG TPA: hypothetical protein DET40_08180 [Lentisphaeria bacterium]|nr:MAG: hypothetical protein A2X45_10385 [Lentisphaerae bacterium GWF2_50_93]HCE43510.1 hypothetical protein [Lentisphaeria bacterium]
MKNKIDEKERLFRRVFAGEEDYMPLIISPQLNCPEGVSYPSSMEFKEDTAKSIACAVGMLKPKVEINSDWIPMINISYYQNILVPSLIGAEIAFQDGSDPMAKRSSAEIKDVFKNGIPPLEGELVEEMIATLRTAKRCMPDDFRLSFPVCSSPFDIAQLMFGEEFLVSSVLEPEMVNEFLMNLTELSIKAFDLVKKEMGQDADEYITNRGLFFPGLRLPCDALVTFSPSLIRDIALPVLKRFGERYGNLCIHYCTSPAPSQHVLPVLLESDFAGAVDNWQGPGVFIGDDAPARMQDRIAIITDIDLSTEEKMRDFIGSKPVREISRKGGRGIVANTKSGSVDEGRRTYETWQKLIR